MDNKIQFDLLRRIAAQIAFAADKFPDKRLTPFLALKGNDYTGELMWVGRAVNGWCEGQTPLELQDPAKVDAFLRDADEYNRKSAENGDFCPMQWVMDLWGASKSPSQDPVVDGAARDRAVSGSEAGGESCAEAQEQASRYNSKKSAFWRTAYQVVTNLGIPNLDADHWPSALVWSNLYKVSQEAGGNPNEKLKALQKDACRKILEDEIAAYRPKRLVLATGQDWAKDFLDLPCFSAGAIEGSRKYAQGVGDLIIDGEKIGAYVVAAHPQGKDETIWVKEVLAALKSQ